MVWDEFELLGLLLLIAAEEEEEERDQHHPSGYVSEPNLSFATERGREMVRGGVGILVAVCGEMSCIEIKKTDDRGKAVSFSKRESKTESTN